tara:strand:+ start:1399 stop:1563 length:165 start_codon:yes stop_codon:yes gene_type:complete
MKDWIELLVAFVLGFFMKSLMGTICQSRLVEGSDPAQAMQNQQYKALRKQFGDV